MSSARQVAVDDVAGGEGDGEHHRAATTSRRRPPVGRGSVSPSSECPSPRKWPASCVAIDCTSKRPASPPGATDHWNVELKKMSDSRISPVRVSIEKRRRGQRALEIGTGRKANDVGAVLVERPAADEPAELEADRCRLDRLPRLEAAADGVAKLRRRDAVDAAGRR